MLFLRKTDETIWKTSPPSFLREISFQLSPLFLRNIFVTPSLSKFQKRETPQILGRGVNYEPHMICSELAT